MGFIRVYRALNKLREMLFKISHPNILSDSALISSKAYLPVIIT